ncbi:MAG: hypothetical protein KF802_01725 [Bdellovibrionaceae bacterium]|nr:hypothetical protein [Pseudobdellovibrionaceae bacterium]MBX3033964.1 hypothetical protein [Pseudobdellovibrionaceae bacterium]
MPAQPLLFAVLSLSLSLPAVAQQEDLRIEDLEVVEEVAIPNERYMELMQAVNANINSPQRIINGNFPSSYTQSSYPSAMTRGTSPQLNSGNLPNMYYNNMRPLKIPAPTMNLPQPDLGHP